MKKLLALTLTLALALSICACGNNNTPAVSQNPATSQSPAASTESASAEPTKPAKKLLVAQTVIDLSNVYFVTLSNGVKAGCEANGFEFLLHDGKSDAALQVSAIENFIVQQVDVLIVTPVDPVALGPVLKQAKEAGIIIINCNQEVETKDAFIRVPEYKYGYTAGKLAADWINANLSGECEVAILNRPVSEPLIARSNGFKDGVTQNSSAVIAAEQAAHTAELGLKAAETILQSNPNISGFICQNDTAALGVYEALMAAGKDPSKTFVVGVDGLQDAYEKILQNSFFKGTVDANPFGMGELAVETAIKVIESGPLKEEINPEIVPVTLDNVAQFKK